MPDSEVYIVRDHGIVVGLSLQGGSAAHPGTDALDFLHRLAASALGGQLVTEAILREYYVATCRAERLKPFPWLAVLREFNRLLKQIYGPAYRKTYGNVYEGGKLRKRRIYLIPRAEQAQEIISQVA